MTSSEWSTQRASSAMRETWIPRRVPAAISRMTGVTSATSKRRASGVSSIGVSAKPPPLFRTGRSRRGQFVAVHPPVAKREPSGQLGGHLHGVDERLPEGAALERVKPGDGRSTGARHHVLQAARVLSGLEEEQRRTE